MKTLLFLGILFIVNGIAIDPTNPVPIPPFGRMMYTSNVSETNVMRENNFYFDCPYNNENITIKQVSYKFQSNSSNFSVLLYNGNMDTNSKEQTGYWQIIGNQCSYYCEANYTLTLNATNCFIFSGYDNYNGSMLISYEIVEQYLGPESPTPLPTQPPDYPPPANNSGSSLSPGAIAGIVIGCLAFLGLLVGVGFYFIKKYDMFNRNIAQN